MGDAIEVEESSIGLIVRVRRWPPSTRVDDYINSCTVDPAHKRKNWKLDPLDERLSLRRLHNHGEAKGRVLYLYQYRLIRGHVLVGGLGYHIEPTGGGRLQVTCVEVTASVPEADVVPAVARLLLCAQRIAQVANLNHGCLQWVCRSTAEAQSAERYYDFKKRGRACHGALLMERPPVF